MAVVPYKPVPDVAISQQATPMLDASTTPTAFGTTIASAIDSVGKATEKVGDEIFARAVALQELQNAAAVTDAETQFIVEGGNLRTKFHSSEGRNAVDNQAQYNQDIQETRLKIRATLPNDMARRKFDSSTQNETGRFIFQGSTHAAQEQKKVFEGTIVASLSAFENEVFHDTSPSALENAKRKAAILVDRYGDIKGWNPVQKGDFLREYESKLIAQRIMGVAGKDPLAAERMWEESKSLIDPKQYKTVQTAVENNMYGKAIENLVGPIAGQVPEEEGAPGVSMRDAVAEAERQARAIRPDDPKFIELAKTRTIAMVNNRRQVMTATERDAWYGISRVMEGGMGIIPQSYQELVDLDPNMKRLWNNLSPPKRNAMIEKFNRGERDYPKTVESNTRFFELQGMAVGSTADLNTKEEFLKTEILNEKLPRADKQTLLKLQEQVNKGMNDDPRVGAAMSWFQKNNMLKSINAEKKDNEKRYNMVQGALIPALQAFRDKYGKNAINDKDYQEVWGVLNRNIGPPPPPEQRTPYGKIMRTPILGSPHQPAFGMEMSQEMIDRAAKLPKPAKIIADRGYGFTKEEIATMNRDYRRREFQKLFGGGGKQ